MKKLYATLLIFFCITSTFAQTWQWGKRGGSTENISGFFGLRQEEAYSIVTDSQKNIYMLSVVGASDLDIDGHTDQIYETGSTTNADIALVSFGCDGSFRWSKIIGGNGVEEFTNLVIDNQDNIYLAGRFGTYSGPGVAQHIDDDVTMSTDPADYRMLVLMKFNSSGVLQWYKKPEPNDVSFFNGALAKGLEIDSEGHLYWLVALSKPGTYADGAFTVTDVSKFWHVLQYNSSGDFVSNTVLDLQTPNTFGPVKFFRNPYNQNFFVTAQSLGDAVFGWAIVGTQSVTHSMFLGCFSSNGQALWMSENTSDTSGMIQIYNLLFDNESNIYIGGSLIGLSLDTFMGLTIDDVAVPAFILKTDSMATTTQWSTYHNRASSALGGVVLKGNEIGLTNYCNSTDFIWGTQTLNASDVNQGNEVLFARFNKNTGACLSLNKIPGNVGFNDYGCTLAVDASGDYILGGNFSGTLTFDGGAQISNIGGTSDFFIAKYATQACSPLGVATSEFDNLTYYPNPTTGVLKIETTTELQYELYDVQGSLVHKGQLDKLQTNIDLSGFAAGTYVLKLMSDEGIRSVKVVKR